MATTTTVFVAIVVAALAVFLVRPSGSRTAPPADPKAKAAAKSVSDPVAELAVKCRRKAAETRFRLGPSFNVLSRPPFVVAGRMPAAQVQGWYDDVIRPVSRALQGSFFAKAPHAAIRIVLCNTETSYAQVVLRLSGQSPTSRFAFYRPATRTVFANVRHGPGTIVHELTHALMAFDFPTAPMWLSEGLAALYEDYELAEPPARTLVGRANWRRGVMQEALRQGNLGSLRSMIVRRRFAQRDEATQYAQSQAFCHFLQESGQLQLLYRRLRDGYLEGVSAERIVERQLHLQSWSTLESEFREWAAKGGAASAK